MTDNTQWGPWIEVPADSMEMPRELAGLKAGEWQYRLLGPGSEVFADASSDGLHWDYVNGGRVTHFRLKLTRPQILEGWIEHDGKGFPEAAKAFERIDTLCHDQTVFTDQSVRGSMMHALVSGRASVWGNDGSPYNIAAWRPHQPAKQEARIPVDEDDDAGGDGAPMVNRAPTVKQCAPDRRILVLDRWGERKAARLAAAREQANIARFFASNAGRPDTRLLTVAPLSRFSFDREA